jgi:hypothetical protein
MASFMLRLPTEILEKFLDLLEDDSSLKSVRQTCRRFQPLSAARLFSSVTVTLSLQGLCHLRKLATCPNIAGHVRRLKVLGGRLDYFRSYDEWKSELERRLAAAEALGFSEGLDPFNGFQEQELEAGWKSYEKLLDEQKVAYGSLIYRLKIPLTSFRNSSVPIWTKTSSLARFAPSGI